MGTVDWAFTHVIKTCVHTQGFMVLQEGAVFGAQHGSPSFQVGSNFHDPRINAVLTNRI